MRADEPVPNYAFYTRFLPHIQPTGATFFVTMRLAKSIPVPVIKALHTAYEEAKTQSKLGTDVLLEGSPTFREARKQYQNIQENYFLLFDAILDRMNKPRFLKEPQIMDIVKEAISFRDGKVLESIAYCIMPNHLHWIFRSYEDAPVLWAMLRDFKKFTGRESNLKLQRTGAFWAKESYDHIVRHETALDQKIKYVLQNPVKANFVRDWKTWPGTWCHPYLLEELYDI